MQPSNYSNLKNKKPLFLLFFLLLFFGMGAVVMFLWNSILPFLINVKTISYWQSLGLFILTRILFGSFSFGKRTGKSPFATNQFKENVMNMTEEEREQFKSEWKKRC